VWFYLLYMLITASNNQYKRDIILQMVAGNIYVVELLTVVWFWHFSVLLSAHKMWRNNLFCPNKFLALWLKEQSYGVLNLLIRIMHSFNIRIMVITKLPNTEQSSKGKGKTHKSTNRQNQSTTGKLGKPQWPWLGTGISKEMEGWIRFYGTKASASITVKRFRLSL
jgi:hypothetical protein